MNNIEHVKFGKNLEWLKPFTESAHLLVPLKKLTLVKGFKVPLDLVERCEAACLVNDNNEFTITFFMYTIDISTLPIWMYSRTVSSLDPSTLALSVFIIAADVVLIVLVDKLIAGRANLF